MLSRRLCVRSWTAWTLSVLVTASRARSSDNPGQERTCGRWSPRRRRHILTDLVQARDEHQGGIAAAAAAGTGTAPGGACGGAVTAAGPPPARYPAPAYYQPARQEPCAPGIQDQATNVFRYAGGLVAGVTVLTFISWLPLVGIGGFIAGAETRAADPQAPARTSNRTRPA